jgi:hypothetical protein
MAGALVDRYQMEQTNVIKFPLRQLDFDRLRLYRDEPCTVLAIWDVAITAPDGRRNTQRKFDQLAADG